MSRSSFGDGPVTCDDDQMSRNSTRRNWSFFFALALPIGLSAGCASTDEPVTSASATTGGSETTLPITTTVTPAEPVSVEIGQPFSLDKAAGFGDPPASLTAVVTSIDYAPVCEFFDADAGEDIQEELPYTAINFDVAVDASSGPVSFGSPGWFQATDPAGYVTDDLTASVPSCDDRYPEFTDSDLTSGQKHQGWVMFDDDDLQPGDSLRIGLPTGTQSAVLTLE